MDEEKYIQVLTPDKIEIARLVNRAKGYDRTMAQFADDCQVSASTLSRIVNGKITKPLAYEMIKRIFDNRADGQDEFLLEALVCANGMKRKGAHEPITSNYSAYTRRNIMNNKRTAMKNIIVSELFDRGIPVINATKYSYGMNENTTAFEIFPGMIGDLAVSLNDTHPDANVWAFYWFPQEPETDENREITAEYIVRRIINVISKLFLVDAWQPEIINGLKTSFVFMNKEVFERFISTLKDAKLNSEMSAILLDVENGSVVEERWLCEGKYPHDASVFNRPKIMYNTDDDKEFNTYDFIDDNR